MNHNIFQRFENPFKSEGFLSVSMLVLQSMLRLIEIPLHLLVFTGHISFFILLTAVDGNSEDDQSGYICQCNGNMNVCSKFPSKREVQNFFFFFVLFARQLSSIAFREAMFFLVFKQYTRKL